MSEHITHAEMESFRIGALPWRETVLCAEHLDTCDRCSKSYHQVSQTSRTFRPLVFNFSLAAHLKEFHLSEYETLAPYVDGELDEEVAEMVELHLYSCQRCREDVRYFKEYRLKEEKLEQGTNTDGSI